MDPVGFEPTTFWSWGESAANYAMVPHYCDIMNYIFSIIFMCPVRDSNHRSQLSNAKFIEWKMDA